MYVPPVSLAYCNLALALFLLKRLAYDWYNCNEIVNNLNKTDRGCVQHIESHLLVWHTCIFRSFFEFFHFKRYWLCLPSKFKNSASKDITWLLHAKYTLRKVLGTEIMCYF